MKSNPHRDYWLHCGSCGWQWVAFRFPIEIVQAQKLSANPCPECKSQNIYEGQAPEKQA